MTKKRRPSKPLETCLIALRVIAESSEEIAEYCRTSGGQDGEERAWISIARVARNAVARATK